MENIKAFLEADALRTQGEWIKGSYTGHCHKKHKHTGDRGDDPCFYEYVIDESPCVSVAPNITLIGWDENGTILDEEDATFIAAASRIAPDIRQLLAAFEQVCGALERYALPLLCYNAEISSKNWQKPLDETLQVLTAAAPYRKGGV